MEEGGGPSFSLSPAAAALLAHYPSASKSIRFMETEREEEEVSNMEQLMVPDSYDGRESEEESYMNSKSPQTTSTLFRSLLRSGNHTSNPHYSNGTKRKRREYSEGENKDDAGLSSCKRPLFSPPSSPHEDEAEAAIVSPPSSPHEAEAEAVIVSRPSSPHEDILEEAEAETAIVLPPSSPHEAEAEAQKFYTAWFHGFVGKQGLEVEYLDQSFLQQLEKSWVQKQVLGSELGCKEAEADVNIIKLRCAMCDHWLSSL